MHMQAAQGQQPAQVRVSADEMNRRLKHPAVMAATEHARQDLFVDNSQPDVTPDTL